MLWKEVRNAVFCLRQKNYNDEENIGELRKRAALIFPLCIKTSQKSFRDLLSEASTAKCTDPRDRVFGVLSMVAEHDSMVEIQADYTKMTSEVYQEVSLLLIKRDESLDILSSCNLDDRSTNLPSWVPDWDVTGPPETHSSLGASGNAACPTEYDGGRILKVTGIRVGTIKAAGYTGFEGARRLPTIRAAIQKNAPLGMNVCYIDGSNILDAYCNTLCCKGFGNIYEPPVETLPNFKVCKSFLLKLLNPIAEIEHLQRDERLFLGRTYQYFETRAFFTTLEGYFGFGPREMRQGDQVCVLLGCSTSIILRPVEDGRYQVVGGAYTQGAMFGECFLGPWQWPYEAAALFDPINIDYWWGFINRQTGETQTGDPREGPLPDGWVKTRHSNDKFYDVFLNQDTGKESKHYPNSA